MADGKPTLIDNLQSEAADLQQKIGKAARGRIPVHQGSKLLVSPSFLLLPLPFILVYSKNIHKHFNSRLDLFIAALLSILSPEVNKIK